MEKPKKGVKFAVATSPEHKPPSCQVMSRTLPSAQELSQISDLCKALENLGLERRQQCLGWLKDDLNRQHQVFPRGTAPTSTWTTKSLRDALATRNSASHSLNREQRLQLAVIISWNVLQLYRTPWLSSLWTPEDIRILPTNKDVSYSEVFVSRNLSQTQNQPTEKQSSPFIRNETLVALGILLIELCLCRPIEDFQTAAESQTLFGDSTILKKYAIASRLLDKVYQEAGHRYESAVRRCLHCNFDYRNLDLEDSAFCEIFYDSVVRPLERDLRNFQGDDDLGA